MPVSDDERKQIEAEAIKRITAIPEINAVIDKIRKGEPVVFAGDKDTKPMDLPEPKIDLEDPSTIGGFVEAKIHNMLNKVLGERLGDVNTKLQSMIGHFQSQQTNDVNRQIDELRKSNPDIDKFLPTMTELAVRNRDLSVHELYAVAKNRASGNAFATERPATSLDDPVVASSPMDLGPKKEQTSRNLRNAAREAAIRVLQKGS